MDMESALVCEDWGLVDYRTAWDRQERLFAEAIRRKQAGLPVTGRLVFCEHPHVYTLGKSGKEQNMLLDALQLRAKHAGFVRTNRGGDITYHGPGQLVGYPILDLEHYGLGLKRYIYIIEETVIRLLGRYGVRAGRLDGATGVWLDAHGPSARKICAIGVRSSHFVTMHGFALNVNTCLDYFNYIHPCGFVDKGVTSMARELGHEADMADVKSGLRELFVQLLAGE